MNDWLMVRSTNTGLPRQEVSVNRVQEIVEHHIRLAITFFLGLTYQDPQLLPILSDGLCALEPTSDMCPIAKAHVTSWRGHQMQQNAVRQDHSLSVQVRLEEVG